MVTTNSKGAWPKGAKYRFVLEGDALTQDRKTVSFKVVMFDDEFISYQSTTAKFRRNGLNDLLRKADRNILRNKVAFIVGVQAAPGSVLPMDSIYAMDRNALVSYVVENSLTNVEVDLYFDAPALREAIKLHSDSPTAFKKYQDARRNIVGNKVQVSKLNTLESAEVQIGKVKDYKDSKVKDIDDIDIDDEL